MINLEKKKKNSCEFLWNAVLVSIEMIIGFPSGSDGKESTCSVGDPVQSLGQEDLLEKGMATHSNIPAWRIPWTEEPDRLQSMGSQRETII